MLLFGLLVSLLDGCCQSVAVGVVGGGGGGGAITSVCVCFCLVDGRCGCGVVLL